MDEIKSKSQKKREAILLQQLGEHLTSLKMEQLKELSLPLELIQAIQDAKQLKSFGAIRRQAQWIGKLMRKLTPEEILQIRSQIS